MTDEPFIITLAGRQWALPHLPFRAIKKIQPALFQIYAELGGGGASIASIAQLSEAQLDRLADAVFHGIAHVDAALTHEAFLDLPFSVSELIQAFPAIAKAAGLRATSAPSEPTPNAAQEAPPLPEKSISIG